MNAEEIKARLDEIEAYTYDLYRHASTTSLPHEEIYAPMKEILVAVQHIRSKLEPDSEELS